MNFFTPQLLSRIQDLRDEEAMRDWDRAAEEYAGRLRQIKGELPPTLRHLIETVNMHDAEVRAMWWGGRTRFHITLSPESDPSRFTILNYSLIEAPEIDRDALPEQVRSTPDAWLYDELDIVWPDASGVNEVTYLHNILLSNGWEVHLRFRAVAVTRPEALIPSRTDPCGDSLSVSRSA